jgi:hypothetical protein
MESFVCVKPLAGLALFLSQAYNLKGLADYELKRGAAVPLGSSRPAGDWTACAVIKGHLGRVAPPERGARLRDRVQSR